MRNPTWFPQEHNERQIIGVFYLVREQGLGNEVWRVEEKLPLLSLRGRFSDRGNLGI